MTSTKTGSDTVSNREEDREALEEKTSREDKMERREELRCSFCRPHKGENANWKRRGKQKRKGKNPRRR